ncbi:DUF4176 domain-containing protein [Pseudobutyrivibrio sp.]|uniref:DUF4176 domain-containing protein n=1 Tax=Pseudobutyrivibrio sp. TaxID=2014367 RepID=UPI001D42A97A|nr:DUF4176 domain-containing protein [Pseudobutyrivibrio sp.]MBE5912008.1 DUF4176 domain-containing protein [Pseudobutyrivibrio sp.]
MKEMKPIGTIITYQQSKFMIIGYETCEIDNSIIPHYVVVPIPLGYMKPESLRVIRVDADYVIVQVGYLNSFGERYLGGKKLQFEGLNHLDFDQLKEQDSLLQEYIRNAEE